MTTLSLLKSTIADDLARPDLTAQIAAAITQAIEFYQDEHFYWTDVTSFSFATVADQSAYTTSDSTYMVRYVETHTVFIDDSDGTRYKLGRMDPVEMVGMLDDDATSGRPVWWSRYNTTFRFYPVPDAVYTVYPIGQIERLGPASDSEPDNPWMTNGFELIRCAAKGYVYLHTMHDPDQAAIMAIAAERELGKLRRETSKRTATGQIVPTQW